MEMQHSILLTVQVKLSLHYNSMGSDTTQIIGTEMSR